MAEPKIFDAHDVAEGAPLVASTLDLPRKAPLILMWRENRLRIVAGVIGLVLGTVVSWLAWRFAAPGSLLAQMFNIRSLSTTIPVAICWFFFWGLSICAFRSLRLRASRQLSRRSLMLHLAEALSSANLLDIARNLDSDLCRLSPLLRRVHAIVRQWTLRPSLQDADLALQREVAFDEESIRAGYSLVRTFVWALPVLGLIGTVIGISVAVGGFSQFLGGDIEDVAIIKKSLVGVTSGLSFAFLITLQGLLGALLLMLLASSLQTKEEAFYAALQKDIADIFLPVLQRAVPEVRQVEDSGYLAAWRDNLQQLTTGVLEQVRTQSERWLSVMESRESAYRERVVEWARTLRTETELGAARLAEAAGQVGVVLKSANGEFLERLTVLERDLGHTASELREALQGLASAIGQGRAEMAAEMPRHAEVLRMTTEAAAQALHNEIDGGVAQFSFAAGQVGAHFRATSGEFLERCSAAGTSIGQQLTELRGALETLARTAAQQKVEMSGEMERHVQTFKGTTEAVARLIETTSTALERQAGLHQALVQLNDAKLGDAFGSFVGALSVQSDQMRAATDAMNGLARQTEEVLHAQLTLERALDQLRDSGFTDTLAGFRESLTSLGPILAGFREPFVLQAVPIDSKLRVVDSAQAKPQFPSAFEAS